MTDRDYISKIQQLISKDRPGLYKFLKKRERLLNRLRQRRLKMNVGDRVKVIDQEVYGKIVRLHSTEVVIEDEDAETWDNELCFKLSEVEKI